MKDLNVSQERIESKSPWDYLAEKNYTQQEKIGEGTFGIVYKGRCNRTKK